MNETRNLPNAFSAAGRIVPGVLACALVAGIASLLGALVPVVGPSVFALTLGILLRLVVGLPAALKPGVDYSSKKILRYSIVVLGGGLTLGVVLGTGRSSLVAIAVTMAAALVATVAAARLLGVKRNLASLIGVGTAICGGSAIAAVAPIIDADDDETAYAVSTIFLFNLAAVFVFPALGSALGLSQRGFGLFAGTAINDTSSVVAAGYLYGDEAGDYATVVKLTRTVMIVPVALAFTAFVSWGARASGGKKGFTGALAVFPWFVLGFLAMSALNSAGVFPPAWIPCIKAAGKFLIALALAGIGFKTDLRAIAASGPKPLVLGFAVWAAVTLASLAYQSLAGAW